MNESFQSVLEGYKDLRSILKPWDSLGLATLPEGTICIGHAPHVGPHAWLHRLMPPLNVAGLDRLQEMIGQDFPSELQQLMLVHNGMILYGGSMSIYGLRTSYQRSDIEAMLGQPFDMTSPNVHERPIGFPEEALIVGSLGDDRDRVTMRPNGSVSLYQRKSGELSDPLYSSLLDFLVGEAKKLNKRFDRFGKDVAPTKLN